MIDDVYNAKILGFAGNITRIGRLDHPGATATAHSRLCGSTVTVDLEMRMEELRVLQLLRSELAVDPLTVAAIERASKARHRSLT